MTVIRVTTAQSVSPVKTDSTDWKATRAILANQSMEMMDLKVLEETKVDLAFLEEMELK